MAQETSQVRSPPVWPAVLAALAIAIVGAASVSMARSMGYDESMHAELPAARMVIAVQLGEWKAASDALLGCQQYPFVVPIALALVQALTGVSELACRMSGRVFWAVALFAIFLVAREVAKAVARDRAKSDAQADSRASWVPWIAMGLAALSPAALDFSGTLFLEVPFIAVAMFAVYAWLRRRRIGSAGHGRQDVVAGAMLALALYTKFNYGLLLAAGCALDLGIEGIHALRVKALRAWLESAALIALVPLIASLWWFVLPLPGNLALGAEHRSAFMGFLAGNQHMLTAPFQQRLFDWGAGIFASPRMLLLSALAALFALRFVRVRELRTLVVIGLVCTIPVAMHPYHMDRLLLPSAPYLWIFAAVGLAALLPRGLGARAVWLGALLALCLIRRDIDSLRLMDWGSPSSSTAPEIAEYRRKALAEKISLTPARKLQTNGLERSESDAALDLIAAEAGGELRIGWLAAIEKLPPGALQVGLLARGGPKQRFLHDVTGSMIFGVEPVDPVWDKARLQAATKEFDVIFTTDPPQAFGSGNKWAFLGDYCKVLTSELGFRQKDFGQIVLHPPLGKDKDVRLIALRASP
ncbi:MAG TPA: hypothetical protein VK843_22485 [Planctomycetota bacterium]|nr:hypothetical protein [Planctomycetota bacterium]